MWTMYFSSDCTCNCADYEFETGGRGFTEIVSVSLVWVLRGPRFRERGTFTCSVYIQCTCILSSLIQLAMSCDEL